MVEKFLIKDKKLEEAERRLQLYHQISLNRDEEDEELQQINNKITRRFTRRRSSADIQLDPEQLEREVAYAQVQAKVLDTLVAEEQAEIENEVRRGTLIKKSNIGGPRTVPGFFRNVDGDSASQGEEEAAAQKMRKTLKKLKKKKKTTEKPSPPDDEDDSRIRRSSTSSDVSVELQTDEKEARKHKKPQMFKVEASNSVGDFSTVLVNSGGAVVEQFRESVKIPVPRRIGIHKTDRDSVDEESETEVVLPVKRPYVKDTSRNSVHFTVRTPPENVKNDPLRKIRPVENGEEKELQSVESKEENKEEILGVSVSKKEEQSSKEIPESPKSPATPRLKKKEMESFKVNSTEIQNKEAPQSPKFPVTSILKKETPKSPVISKFNKTGPLEKKTLGSPKSPDVSPLKKEESPKSGKPATTTVDETSVVLGVDPLANENSASAALPSVADRLPKASKINTDENNAVEAPKRSLREAEYLAKPTKSERDEDVGYPLPGKKANKALTLKNASDSSASGAPVRENQVKQPSNREEPLGKNVTDDATGKKLVTKTTLFEDPKVETSGNAAEKKGTPVEDVKGDKVKDSSLEKLAKSHDEEASRIPVKVTLKKEEADPWKRTKTESNKAEKKSMLKDSLQNTLKTESKIPWRNKVSKTPGDSVPLDRSISVDPQIVSRPESIDPKSLKQSTSLEENLISKMPVDKQHLIKSYESLNGDSGTLSKSTSSESIDFWSEIKGPDSPKVAKVVNREFSFVASKNVEPVEDPIGKEVNKKKETVAKISVAAAHHGLSNIPVIEEESLKCNAEQRVPVVAEKSETEKDVSLPKKGLKKKNLSLAINSDAYSTVKKAPLKREDSNASTISAKSVSSTPDTSVPVSEVSTPVAEVVPPLINIIDTPTPTRTGSQILDEEDEVKTPTNEWSDPGFPKISKWSNHSDLSNVDQVDNDVTPVPSKDVSVACSPENSPDSSKKKKIVRKKKSSTTKSSTKKSSTKKESKDSKRTKKNSSKVQENLKPTEPSSNSPKNSPTQRPIDLIKMFYTTPMALLTATPRDLSKVRRAKIKRKKHHSRTPSISSDSTGSTTSTATTESSGSTCAELDDDPEHKRMNSTRSNDSGFDGSPRISSTCFYSIFGLLQARVQSRATRPSFWFSQKSQAKRWMDSVIILSHRKDRVAPKCTLLFTPPSSPRIVA